MSNFKPSNNLNKYINYIDFIDRSDDSKNYFRIRNFPVEFFKGVNTFNIFPLDKFVKNSRIYIDVLDSNNQPINYSISKTLAADNSRIVTVEITDRTPRGDVRIYIAGRLKQNPVNNVLYEDKLYKDSPNIVWVRKVAYKSKGVPDDLIFNEEPVILYQEITQNIPYYSSSLRYVEVSAAPTSRLWCSTPALSKFDSYDGQIKPTTNKIVQPPVIDDLTGKFITDNKVYQKPDSDQYSVFTSTNFNFSKDMKDGRIYVTTDNALFLPNGVPTGSLPIYSGSIIEVIDYNNIKVFPPYRYDLNYPNNGRVFSVNRFSNVRTFTVEYYSSIVGEASLEQQSFIELELLNITPKAGYLHNIEIKYSSTSGIGQPLTLGFYNVEPVKILVDKNTVEDTPSKLEPLNIGKFPDIMTDYWDYSGTMPFSSATGVGQFYLPSDYIITLYQYTLAQNTEYEISFDYDMSKSVLASGVSPINLQYDFYFVVYQDETYGSDIEVVSKKSRVHVYPEKTTEVYLGSLCGLDDVISGTKKIIFKNKIRKKIRLKIVKKSGVMIMSNLQVNASTADNKSPGHSLIYVPIDQLPAGNEYIFEITYFTKSGKRIDRTTKLFPLALETERILKLQ